MLNTILIDAGPIIALFDKDDNFHKKVVSFIKGKHFKFITTIAVITEVSHMLDFSTEAQIAFLEWIMKEGVIIEEVHQNDIARILELTKKYRDLPMDFADASLVITSEKTGIRKVISIDSDFDIYRLPGKVKIENVFT
jgi:predicted nucleic acid-binding protein